MGRHCFVPKCTTSYDAGPHSETKLSLFQAPRDAVLRVKWNEAIARPDKNLSERDSVCELHFKKGLVIKEWTADYKGAVLMRVPFKPRLAKDAIPSVFTHNTVVTCDISEQNKEGISPQDYVNDNPEYITGDLNGNDLSSANEIKTVVKQEVIAELCPENSLKNYTYHCSVTAEGSINQILPTDSLHHETTNTNQITIALDPTLYPDNISTNPISFEDFLSIYDNLILPSKSWSVRKHITDHTSLISFYDCGFSKTNHVTVRKEVLVSENMEVSVYVLRRSVISHVVNAEPFSINHLLEVLRLVDLLQMCSGGPTKGSFPGCQPETAVLDIMDVWRHRKCEIISETHHSSFQCAKCTSLFNTFRNQIKRKRNRKITYRIRNPKTYT